MFSSFQDLPSSNTLGLLKNLIKLTGSYETALEEKFLAQEHDEVGQKII